MTLLNWLAIATVTAALYFLMRWGARRMDELTLRAAESRVPGCTVWRYECAWCDRTYMTETRPYDPQHGRETVSHGICPECYEDMLSAEKVVSIDAFRAPPRPPFQEGA